MTRIEQIVRQVSDLRDFYLRLQKARRGVKAKPDRTNLSRESAAS